ncbi:hypothetical protein GEMRC1_012480 [Eukaryota sp. GEM-RC1]
MVDSVSLIPPLSRSKITAALARSQRKSLLPSYQNVTDAQFVQLTTKYLEDDLLSDWPMYVFSDVFLDNDDIVNSILSVFSTLNENIQNNSNFRPPIAIVMMGNFSNSTNDKNAADLIVVRKRLLVSFFVNFLTQISTFEYLIKRTKFIFVSGPQDPVPNLTPRPELFPNLSHFSQFSNIQLQFEKSPFRMKFLDREIVFSRDDLSLFLSQVCFSATNPNYSLSQHLSWTIASQKTLSPYSPLKKVYGVVSRLYY